MNILRGAAVCGAILLAGACAQTATDASIKTQQSHRLIAKTFLDLPAWSRDRHGEALHAFLKSCPILVSRAAPVIRDVFETPPDWRRVCAEAGQTDPDDQIASRLFFETWFRPYLVTVRSAQDGLFTGYFEAELQGARTQDETFKYPLYGIPSDLISVDLGCFDGRLRGRSVIGRVEGGRLLPYYRRADIQQGSIGRRAKVLAWVDDRIDAFLLHVQGSGRILLPDGDVLRIGYAGNNGHGYVSIGRALIKKGELSAGQAGWTQIRRWIEMNPQKTDALLAENPRYIFFREIPGRWSDRRAGCRADAAAKSCCGPPIHSAWGTALARHGLAGRRQSTVAAAHGGARYGQCDQGTDPGRLLLGLWAGRAG